MNHLIIPMMVEAFLKNDVRSMDSRIPASVPNYRDAVTNSFLGSSNTPQPFNMDMEPLACGVHLHFVLPDAFTRADDQNQYPAVPDRFLVTRLAVTKEKTLTVRRFAVESNFISDRPEYSGSVTIPMFSDGLSGSMFRYLGRCYDENCVPGAEGDYLPKLTAIGPGDPSFAAYYPACSSVFGFCDRMEDVPDDTNLSYFVTGYFSEESLDPMNSVTDEKSFREALGRHGLSVKAPERFCGSTLLFGEVGGIVWKGPSCDYGKGIPQGEIEVYVGNTSAEALSAAIRKHMPEAGLEERYLTALQYALLESAEEIDGNFLIDDGIHTQRFEAVQNRAGGIAVSAEKGAAGTGKAYSALIRKMEASGAKKAELDWKRQKLFCLWEQYMCLYENADGDKVPSKKTCMEELQDMIERIKAAEAEAVGLEQEVGRLRDTLTGSLPEGASLKTSGGEPYYFPKDPSVLLCGDGLKRSFAFGEDGRYTEDGTLLCQTEPVTCNVDTDTLLSCLGAEADCAAGLKVSDCYRGLLAQAILLSPELRTLREEALGSLEVQGEVSEAAVSGVPQSFTTLFMDWSVRFYPTRTSGAGEEDNTLEGWELPYGETDYITSRARGAEQNIVYTGRTVVTPHSVYNLKAAMAKWLEYHSEDEEARAAAAELEKLPVLSQNMDGLTGQLCAWKRAFQFQVIGGEGEEALAAVVEELVGCNKVSPAPTLGLYSMRGGYFRADRINLLGTFGQVQHVIVPPGTAGSMQKIYYSETLRAQDENYGLLSPAFTVPARLEFQWVSRDDHDCLSSADEATAPVCGFLLPELLNRRLLAYTGEGTYIGALKTVYRSGKEEVRWVSAPELPEALQDLELDGTLKSFLLSMQKGDGFSGLMKLINVNFEKALPSAAGNTIWGRPLALARAAVSLLLQGGAEYTKSFQDFGTYNTQGVERVRIPLHLGDALRAGDGMTAVFPDVQDEQGNPVPSFEYIYPAWGSPAFENSRILFGTCPELSVSDGKRFLTLLLETGREVCLQTGLLPVKRVSLPAEHAKNTEKLVLAAGLTSVLTTRGIAELPVIRPGTTERFGWCYPDRQGKMVVEQAAAPTADFAERYLCDGMLLRKKVSDE